MNESPSAFQDSILSETADNLRSLLTSSPPGILITGAHPKTLQALVRLATPDVTFHSCAHSLLGASQPQIIRPGAVVCVDDVDIESEGVEPFLKGLFSRLAGKHTIIGLAASEKSTPPSLLRANRFEQVLHVEPPSIEVRRQTWDSILRTLENQDPIFAAPPDAAFQLALSSPSFDSQDYRSVLHAYLAQLGRPSTREGHTYERLKSIVSSHAPVASTKELPFASRSTLASRLEKANDWGNHVGYEDVKQKLMRFAEWPILHKETFRRLGVSAPRGILLYGPHGCGKTMLVNAFIKRTQHANWISVHGPDIFSKYLGESEKRIGDLFTHARKLRPCILIIDDIDAIGAVRSGEHDDGSSGVERRVVASLLAEMDGVEAGDILVIGCASDVNSLDPALVRPGRMDCLVEVSYPDESDRAEIVQMLLKGVELEDGFVDTAVHMTQGSNGADLTTICRETWTCAMEAGCTLVTKEHFRIGANQTTMRSAGDKTAFILRQESPDKSLRT